MREIIERGLKSGQFRRLLPRHHIYLFAPKGGGERFARLFVETWRRLPLYARRRILKHWKNDRRADTVLRPQIELLSGWAGREKGPGLGGTKGAAGGNGH